MQRSWSVRGTLDRSTPYYASLSGTFPRTWHLVGLCYSEPRRCMPRPRQDAGGRQAPSADAPPVHSVWAQGQAFCHQAREQCPMGTCSRIDSLEQPAVRHTPDNRQPGWPPPRWPPPHHLRQRAPARRTPSTHGTAVSRTGQPQPTAVGSCPRQPRARRGSQRFGLPLLPCRTHLGVRTRWLCPC